MMNRKNLINKLIGKWITQDNFYSLNNKQQKGYKNIYTINWSYYSSCKLTEFIKIYKSKTQINHYIDGVNLIKSIDKNQDQTYYSFLFHPFYYQGILLKVDASSLFITKSRFYYSNKTIIYKHDLNKKTKIVEKSYFLSDTVKLNKCFIIIDNLSQASYFCSQIKIN